MIFNITVDIRLCCMNSCPFPAVQHSSVSVRTPLVHHFSPTIVFKGSCSALGEIQQPHVMVCCRTIGESCFFFWIHPSQAKEFSLTCTTDLLDPLLVSKQKEPHIQAKVVIWT